MIGRDNGKVSDGPTGRHGLESFLLSLPERRPPDSRVRVSIRSESGHVNLRGDAADAAFTSAVQDALGQSLPAEPNTTSAGAHRVYWLGPDEWLIASEHSQVAELIGRLERATRSLHASVTDVSGGQTVIRLSGPCARDVLAKGCTLDLHPDVFKTDDCAQSGLAKAAVLIACIDPAPVFDIVVRRSFADYLCRWLSRAADEFGVAFDANS